jgi:hypothetical protein
VGVVAHGNFEFGYFFVVCHTRNLARMSHR